MNQWKKLEGGGILEKSDSQRITEFTNTGDASVLTPALARHMLLGSGMMSQVPGKTEEDMKEALERDREGAKKDEREFLQPYGLDEATLESNLDHGSEFYLWHLSDVSQSLPDITDQYKQENDSEAIEVAKKLIVDYVLGHDDGVSHLCQSVRLYSAAGVRDVQVLKYVHNYLYDRFVDLSNQRDLSDESMALGNLYSERLNHFSEFSEEVLHANWHEKTNFLAMAYLQNLALELKFSEPATLDSDELPLIQSAIGLERVADFNPDTLLPFEITKNHLALFGSDMNVIYILNEIDSEDYGEDLLEIVNDITYSVAGQYFARRVVATIPPQLSSATEVFYDLGQQLGRDTNIAFHDNEQLRDYLFLMRRAMRETMESAYGFGLKNLTIKEQLHFLDYLKHATVVQSEILSSFITHFDIDAMRSFLSLSQTEGVTGDEIIGFGLSVDENLAKEVFARYSRMLDSINDIGTVIEGYTAKENRHDQIVQEKIATSLTKRADQFFAKAIRALDTNNLVATLDQFIVEGAIFAATARTLYEQGDFKLDDMRNTELAIEGGALLEQDADTVRNLYKANYNQPRFKTFLPAVLEKFDESTKRPDATWYLLRHESNVIGSARFLPQVNENGKIVGKHFGAFNVHQGFGNGKLGEAMFMEFIAEEAKTGVPINAECVPDSPIASKYIESGFVGTHTIEFGGIQLLCITYTPQLIDKELLTVTPKDLVEKGWQGQVVREIITDDTFPELQAGKQLRRYVSYQDKKYGLFI